MSLLPSTKPYPPCAFLLSLLPDITPQSYWSLIETFGPSKCVLTTPVQQLRGISAKAKSLVAEFQRQGNNSQLVNVAQDTLNKLDIIDAQLVDFEDIRYPQLLKEIHSPPPVLYVKGNVNILQLPQIAIVGSRRASIQGKKNTRLFAKHLSQHGLTITSGLALGVDEVAHHSTLAVNGSTIAVMATGIEQIYPKQHRHLADDIINSGGTLITEFPLGSNPTPNRFPQRNRIISGLSMGVLVTEAAIRSGSLITARYAMEQGREVFALPNSIHHPGSRGCHQLIKQGAILVEKSSDIIEHLSGFLEGFQVSPKMDSTNNTHDNGNLTNDEACIMQHIAFDVLTVEELIQETNISSQRVSEALIHLEIAGKIQRSPQGYEKT